MKIGPYQFENSVFAAPMAGVSDAIFRNMAVNYGAALAVSEMISSNALLYGSTKTKWRLQHQHDDDSVRSVQIVGHDPEMMAQAAKLNVNLGAQIIDINMGCPAKKVCNKLAGSALLIDEQRVERILYAVVNAVSVPVTLKIRTGTNPQQRNGVRIAQIAQRSGIQAIAVHGRTRECRFKGQVEYQTIRDIKRAIDIPVIANGDIDNAIKAREVLGYTGADGIMVGRAGQGAPWIYEQIIAYLDDETILADPGTDEIGRVLLSVLEQMYRLYGEYSGVRIARKHISWYTKGIKGSNEFRKIVNLVESSAEQFTMTHEFFKNQTTAIKIAA